MNGNDRLFSLALQSQASGCITALASLASPLLRRVWDHASRGEQDGEAQSRLNAARDVLDAFPPAAAFIKEMLHSQYHFPSWGVRRPLTQLQQALAEQAAQRWAQLNHV